MSHLLVMRSLNKLLMNCWTMAGEFMSPKNMTEFQEPFMGYKGGFPLVSIFDSDIVVSLVDIELGKNLCSLELINKVRDEEKGVGVPNGIFIQVAIVLEWMNCHPSF